MRYEFTRGQALTFTVTLSGDGEGTVRAVVDSDQFQEGEPLAESVAAHGYGALLGVVNQLQTRYGL